MSMYDGFFSAVENRRTYYNISKESPVSDEELEALVKRSVKHAPNSFNMQQSRAVLITGKKHDDWWDTVLVEARKAIPEDEKFNQLKGRVEGAFKAGYGTVLFFEDQAVITGWGKQMPDYAEVWSENAAGILQYIVWTALETKGLGASLQHYAGLFPPVQTALAGFFGVPETWKCTAMMPFGKPLGPPGNPAHPKEFQSLEDRVKVIV